MSQALEEVRDFRHRGELALGMQRLIPELLSTPEPAALVEALRLSLLAGDLETVTTLHQWVDGNGQCAGIEPELALRLQLLGGSEEAPASVLSESPPEPAQRARWVSRYAADGIDPSADLRVDDVQLIASPGQLEYEFRGSCPWCDARQSSSVRRSFLVRRRWLCSVCFGSLELRFVTIRNYLREHHGQLLSDDVHRWDPPLIELQHRLSAPKRQGPTLPRICHQISNRLLNLLSQQVAQAAVRRSR